VHHLRSWIGDFNARTNCGITLFIFYALGIFVPLGRFYWVNALPDTLLKSTLFTVLSLFTLGYSTSGEFSIYLIIPPALTLLQNSHSLY